jgi:hypothetical protein
MTRSGPLSYLLDNSHEAVDLMRTVAWKAVAKGGDDASENYDLWLDPGFKDVAEAASKRISIRS